MSTDIEQLRDAIEASNLSEEVKANLRDRLEPAPLPVRILSTALVQKIEVAECSAEGKGVLQAISAGVPFQDAVTACGCEDISATWREVVRLNLIGLDDRSLMDQSAEIAWLAGEQIVGRLTDPDEKLTPAELNYLRGTSMDKLIRAGSSGRASGEARLAELIAKLHDESAPGTEFRLEVKKADPVSPAIDVTPSEGSDAAAAG